MITKILIIESLTDDERHTGKELYDDIVTRYIHYFNPEIRHDYTFVNTKEEFLNRLTAIHNEIETEDEIILHIEAHGGNQELQLRNNEKITWKELEDYLIELNKKCKNKLHLNLATCHGMHVAEKISLLKTAPYKTYISALNTLSPSEIIEDNSVLYEELIKSREIFEGFVSFLNRRNPTQLRMKDIKTVLEYVISFQIMRFIVLSPTFELKNFLDVYLNIVIDNEALHNFQAPNEKVNYILSLFYERYFPEN